MFEPFDQFLQVLWKPKTWDQLRREGQAIAESLERELAHTDCMSTHCPACNAEHERTKSEAQKQVERLDARRIDGLFY